MINLMIDFSMFIVNICLFCYCSLLLSNLLIMIVILIVLGMSSYLTSLFVN